MNKKHPKMPNLHKLDDKHVKLKENKQQALHEKELRKNKQRKIEELEKEVINMNAQLNSYFQNENKYLPVDRMKVEINNLEIKLIQQRVYQAKLDDHYIMLERAHILLTKKMKNAHIALMDFEEFNYMMEKIENDKNELLLQRNFIKEMQKIGWTNLPPKVADECKKTQMELEYLHKITLNYKIETDEITETLKANAIKLKQIEDNYNVSSMQSRVLEERIDEIIIELDVIIKLINSKQQKAMDLEVVVRDISSEINIATEFRKSFLKKTEDERRKHEKQLAREKKDRLKRNKALDDLTKTQNRLKEKCDRREKILRQKERLIKEIQQATLENKKQVYNKEDLRDELELIKNEVQQLKESVKDEVKLKLKYFNILEDMLGKLKITCRCRDGTKDNISKVIDERTLILTTTNEQYSFDFDYCYETKCKNQNIFENIEYLYEMAIEGYNCYVVSMGTKDSGKSFLTFGTNEDGLVWLGVDKIKKLRNFNSKGGIQTRMFVCSVEMMENQIFDLIEGNLNNKIEIKMDAFKMTVMSYANYRECFSDEEVRKTLREAVRNRTKAATSLKSTDTTFVFLVTFQIYNKFIHRYWKGKVTHVKLASFKAMSSLNKELERVSNGMMMNSKDTKIIQLLRDCFGGSSKTYVIGMINPSENCVQDTVVTLSFIKNLKTIINEIWKNSEPE